MNELDSLLEQWVDWKAKLTEAKEKEVKLRKAVCASVFGESKAKQQSKITSMHGTFKANNTTTMKIDREALNSIYDELSDTEIKCISWEPKVKWASIPDNSVLWDIITEKPTTPTLTKLD